MVERRRFVRLYLPIRVEYNFMQIKGLKKNTLVYNIGGGGICFYTEENLKCKDTLSLEVYFPDGMGSLCAEGEIIWIRTMGDKTMAGLKFSKISSFDRSRIVTFVNSEMQKEKSLTMPQSSQIIFFKETVVKDKPEIMNLLLAHADKIERDLRFIDKNVDFGDAGKLDVLGIDSYGELVLVEIVTEEDDKVLVSALQHFDWALRHTEILSKIYNLHINPNLKPRLMMIAPKFTEPFKRLVECISSFVDTDLFEFSCVESRESKGIFLKKASTLFKEESSLPKDFFPKTEPSSFDKKLNND